MLGLFITGTDTGVGKTVLAAAIVARLRASGLAVRALKPVMTGLDEPAEPDWPHDHELLATAAGCQPSEVTISTYRPAVSPHLAAERSGRPVQPHELLAGLRTPGGDVTVVEGVGGLLVPLTWEYDVRRLAHDLGLPLLIAARAGLGTINHTLLTLEAARRAELQVAAVVLTPWPEWPTELELSNRSTIERLGEVPVWTLPAVAGAAPELLAAAAAHLPLDQWLAEAASVPSAA
jgi:dethiobiotin synthetase